MLTYESVRNSMHSNINRVYAHYIDKSRPQQKLQYKSSCVYSLDSIDAFIHILKGLKKPGEFYDDVDMREKYCARFVVVTADNNQDFEMLFAREGTLSAKIPAHTEMTNKECYAAGNIKFNEDYTQIIGISNKTGHYRCDIGSIIIAISSLLKSNPDLIADNIDIEIWQDEGDDIKQGAITTFSKAELSAICQNRGIEQPQIQASSSSSSYALAPVYDYSSPPKKSRHDGIFHNDPKEQTSPNVTIKLSDYEGSPTGNTKK
jgi:hypothetical protein